MPGTRDPTLILDCHVHLNKYDPKSTETLQANLDALRAQIEKWDLDMVFVLTSYTVNRERPSAPQLLELLRPDDKMRVVEGLGVTQKPDWRGVEDRLRAKQTIGLKLYPGYEHVYPYDNECVPAIELAAKYKVPVMIHCGDTFSPRAKIKYTNPIHVDDVAVDYPDVHFIICHLGNPWFRESAELIYKNENVHADISGLTLEEFSAPLESKIRAELQDVLLYSGDPDGLLFGTDWPLVRMGPYIRFVDQLELEPDVKEKLMWRNAAKLFKVDLPHRERKPVNV